MKCQTGRSRKSEKVRKLLLAIRFLFEGTKQSAFVVFRYWVVEGLDYLYERGHGSRTTSCRRSVGYREGRFSVGDGL